MLIHAPLQIRAAADKPEVGSPADPVWQTSSGLSQPKTAAPLMTRAHLWIKAAQKEK